MDEDVGTLSHAPEAVKARRRPMWAETQLIITA